MRRLLIGTALLVFVASSLVGCRFLGMGSLSRSPFSRSPADLAKAEPCRYLGTFHKESRRRIEDLRSCNAIDQLQWECTTSALKQLDREFTDRCRSEAVSLKLIEARQRLLYEPCLPRKRLLECTLLSSRPRCVSHACD